MKLRTQWTLAGASKRPMSVNADGKMFSASVTSPGEWLTFEQAIYFAVLFKDVVTTFTDKEGQLVVKTGFDIGYILTADDPFNIMDFDVKDAETHPGKEALWTKQETFDLYWRIVQTLDTYTERSRSGKGLHAISYGKIGPGRRRDGIEIYSQERFIICTGDVVFDKPVRDNSAIVQNMIAQMRIGDAKESSEFMLEEIESDMDDWYVLETAMNAANADKFLPLWYGEWQDLGFPSQSEADMALMSMFTFYSYSNEQCRRLFRESGLGKREKAIKNDVYLNRTLREIRMREARDLIRMYEVEVNGISLKDRLAAESRVVSSLGAPSTSSNTVPAVPTPASATAAALAPVSAAVASAPRGGLDWPPGFVGVIARYIYSNSGRPVKEVSIAAALALSAGICGKAWYFTDSGLNLYIILVGRSGIGKEALHTGISSILIACRKDNPLFGRFISTQSMASGQALMKEFAERQSFVHINGEWGRLFKQLADERSTNSPVQSIRTVMTNVYGKSGPNSVVGGLAYSNKENDTADVQGLNYTMVGETVPDVLFRAMSHEMMADGFLSRFTIIEYEGERPPENMNRLGAPDSAMIRHLNTVAVQADMLNSKGTPQHMGRTEEAALLIDKFDKYCDDMVNSFTDESRRQMWNRASLKAQRIACVLAAMTNCFSPNVTADYVLWAQDLIMRDIASMTRRLDTGDIGEGDNARELKLVAIMKDYLLNEPKPGYKVPKGMRDHSIIPHSYLQTRVARTAAFTNHRLGANKALDDSIMSMLKAGWIVETSAKTLDVYKFRGKAYSIVDLPNQGVE